jgi:uncharacterized membrane protein (DUF485 family)
MDATEVARIRNDPAFQELERKRSNFSWSLTILMLVIYLGFIFLVAFDHEIVAKQIGEGPLTLAFPLGLGVIVAAVVLTGIYVARANSEFDRLTAEVVGHTRRSTVTVGGRLVETLR